VIEPGEQLIRKILKRGVASGEFNIPDVDYAVYSIVAPMVWLMMMKHSLVPCMPRDHTFDPVRFLQSQVEILMDGLNVRPDKKPGKARKLPAR
jgi:hypothetical protein